jgi:hypothetical protein
VWPISGSAAPASTAAAVWHPSLDCLAPSALRPRPRVYKNPREFCAGRSNDINAFCGAILCLAREKHRSTDEMRCSIPSRLDHRLDDGHQERELREVASRIGCEFVKVYKDHGISGAKGGRDRRPAFDALRRDATQRRFDLVMAWSVDRLGRSLQDLIGFLSELHALGINLFFHQQRLETTTPSGKATYQMLGVFAEFERAMIQE